MMIRGPALAIFALSFATIDQNVSADQQLRTTGITNISVNKTQLVVSILTNFDSSQWMASHNGWHLQL